MKIRKVPARLLDAPRSGGRRSAGSRRDSSDKRQKGAHEAGGARPGERADDEATERET